MVSTGNHPQMAELFRLVNYYNLPSIMCNPIELVKLLLETNLPI